MERKYDLLINSKKLFAWSQQFFSVILLSTLAICTIAILYTVTNSKLDKLSGSLLSAPGFLEKSSDKTRQLDCLAQNIYWEAANEPFEGKVAVAQVTINRADHPSFPKDICQVVYQKNVIYSKVVCQFSWVCEHKAAIRQKDNDAFRESYEVAKRVYLESFRLPSLHDALYYHASYVQPGWRLTRITQIGQHIFYKGNA